MNWFYRFLIRLAVRWLDALDRAEVVRSVTETRYDPERDCMIRVTEWRSMRRAKDGTPEVYARLERVEEEPEGCDDD